MDGEAGGDRFVLEGARVYIHVTHAGNERIVHIDIDHPDLEPIVPVKEATFAGGKKGGVFIGLRPAQIERAERYVAERVPE